METYIKIIAWIISMMIVIMVFALPIILIIWIVKNKNQNTTKINEITTPTEEKKSFQEVHYKNIQSTENNCLYIKKPLLTPNEAIFYNKIKNEIYKRNLHIIAKIRLADLIEPKNKIDKKEYYSCFAKIKSKHIDFGIVDNNMNVKYLIELDDSSHRQNTRKERDIFVNETLENTGYKLIRVYNNTNGVNTIIEQLNKDYTIISRD